MSISSSISYNQPIKTREIHNHHLNSSKWNEIIHREGDIVISTAYKSGTTWLLTTVMELLYQNKEKPIDTNQGTWIDLRMPPIEEQIPLIEAIKDRRMFKSHLRLDCLPYSEKVKYICVCRDGRDVYMSLLHHYQSTNAYWYNLLSSPGLIGDKIPVYRDVYPNGCFFDDWISKGWPSNEGETDGYPFWSTFDHVITWWEYRHLPNILLVHYNDMLTDLKGSVREVAEFLDIPIQEEGFDELVQSLTFDSMKKNAENNPNIPGILFEGGNNTFMNSGGNGKWKNVLSSEQIDKYIQIAKSKLSTDCYLWLESGKLSSNIDPKLV